MGNKAVGILENVPKRLAFGGEQKLDGTPFRIYSSAPTAIDVNVRISSYSRIFNSPNLNDVVQLIGCNLKFKVKYAEKIWLEIFYDKNLTPVFGIINHGNKWTTKTVNPSNKNQLNFLYPNEMDFITKYDLVNKIADLDNTVNNIQDMKASAIAEITYQNNVGIIPSDQFNAYNASLEKQYSEVITKVKDYKNSINNFFSDAPSQVWKKLFRTYTLIGYTTKDFNNNLDGIEISPPIEIPSSTPSVPTATPKVNYKIVQCLDNDLLLADMSYQNRYPARLPMPYHRSVYYYPIDGKEEEAVNTK